MPTEPEPVAQPPKPTAKDVAGAPRPGDESGRLDRVDEGDGTGRVFARGVLFVPKVVAEIGFAPVRGALWADDRYQLEDLYYRTFYNSDRTIGIIPTASYTTGIGGGVGARFLDLDTFGEHEHTTLEATTGLVYRESVLGKIDTGNRLGALRLELGGNFDRRPDDPFYGIGNGDLARVTAGPIDPLTSTTAFETFHRYQEERADVIADVAAISDLHLIATGSITDLKFARSTSGAPIDEVYSPADLVGFQNGVEHTYEELEVRWDDRRAANMWEPIDLHGTGTLARAFAGQIHRLDDGSDFWRYGGEVQEHIHLGNGPRVLSLRLYGEGVTGNIDDVPFTELPALGGDSYLRGYVYERFRDRVAAFGSVQYTWDLAHNADIYLFVDAGRVYDSLDALTLDHMRAGYGLGLEFHSDSGFLMEGSIASSIDGGIVLTASFNPIYNERRRWR